jgi:3-mercaptopyruvate sulfurtransferase SseA
MLHDTIYLFRKSETKQSIGLSEKQIVLSCQSGSNSSTEYMSFQMRMQKL